MEFGLALTALTFGFRHGIDWDHIAALSDFTVGEPRRRRAMFVSACYAAGHALVVFVLGVAVIVASAHLPGWIDATMEHVVGVTLVGMGAVVLTSVARRGADARMRSRWMLVIEGAGRAVDHVRGAFGRGDLVVIEHDHPHRSDDSHHHANPHEASDERTRPELIGAGAVGALTVTAHAHGHRHVGRLPRDPDRAVTGRTAASIGVLHGIGAETPTQVLLFTTAAGVGNRAAAVALLVVFLVGLLAANTVVALATSSGVADHPRVKIIVSLATAVFSLTVGAMFLFGSAGHLPALLGG